MPSKRYTLHQAMKIVLQARPDHAASPRLISDEVARLDLYRRGDGEFAEDWQILLRARRYPKMFHDCEPGHDSVGRAVIPRTTSRPISPRLLARSSPPFLWFPSPQIHAHPHLLMPIVDHVLRFHAEHKSGQPEHPTNDARVPCGDVSGGECRTQLTADRVANVRGHIPTVGESALHEGNVAWFGQINGGFPPTPPANLGIRRVHHYSMPPFRR